ncbi:MAG: stage II sporulation protein M, partial [Verrucomicrobiota bacterium]
MNAKTFQRENRQRWGEMEEILTELDAGRADAEQARKLPSLFRQACGDLALAQHRMYGLTLCERINRLVIRGYDRMNRGLGGGWTRLIQGFWYDIPQAVRREWKLLWLVMIVFWLPFGAMYASGYFDARWIHSILGPESMESLEAGFGKEGDVASLRDNFGSDFAMFGHYVRNNIGIDLQVFAGGILAGVGTLFFVIFNAIAIGAAAGYVAQEGDPEKFVNWISGHVTPEFLGLLLSAMAGLRLGLGLIRRGRLPFSESIVRAAKKAVPLLFGAVGMTFFAAIVEGFWSPRVVSPDLKYVSSSIARQKPVLRGLVVHSPLTT